MRNAATPLSKFQTGLGRTADLLCCLDFLILNELGQLRFAQAGGQPLFRLISGPYERNFIIVTSLKDVAPLLVADLSTNRASASAWGP